jgi:hypothetical protein
MTYLLRGIVITVVLGGSMPAAAEPCKWQLKEGRAPALGGGIVCMPGQTEFQIAFLACEDAPLHLDLEGDCGPDKTTCDIRFSTDLGRYDVIGKNHPVRQIWDGSIEIPLTGLDDLVAALLQAKRIDVSVEDATGRPLPTEALGATLETLTRSCHAKTS